MPYKMAVRAAVVAAAIGFAGAGSSAALAAAAPGAMTGLGAMHTTQSERATGLVQLAQRRGRRGARRGRGRARNLRRGRRAGRRGRIGRRAYRGRRYRGRRRGRGWIGPAIGAGIASIIIGGAIDASKRRYRSRWERCDDRYRSFRWSDGTFQPYGGGPRKLCPYLRG